MKHTDLTVGKTLPNGAIVMAWVVLSKEDMIILCQWDDKYVSWTCSPEDMRSTSHGHYSSDRAVAVSDFGDRIEDRLCYIRDNCTSYECEGESHHV